MFFSSGWLGSLIERFGLTEWVRELRTLIRRAWDGKTPGDEGASIFSTPPVIEPLDSQPDVRSESSPSSSTEYTMPKKPQAKSKKTSQASSPRAKSPTRSSAAKKAAPARKAAAKRGSTAGRATAKTTETVKQLVEALQSHPQQKGLLTAGQQKDQLLRSLIPLYLARSLDIAVTSGTTSRFWGKLGISYAAPNAAKALRIHTGYASETKKGRAITAKGIKYVEQAIAKA